MPLTASNIDIKILIKNKKRVVNAIVIIIGIIISLNILYAQRKLNLDYHKKLEMEKQKNNLLKEIVILEERLQDCRNSLKRKDTSEMVATINALIEQTGIKLLVVKPLSEEYNPLYIKSRVKFILEAEDYHAIGTFISRLEASDDLYKIESLYMEPAKRSGLETTTLEGEMGLDRVIKAEIIVLRFNFRG